MTNSQLGIGLETNRHSFHIYMDLLVWGGIWVELCLKTLQVSKELIKMVVFFNQIFPLPWECTLQSHDIHNVYRVSQDPHWEALQLLRQMTIVYNNWLSASKVWPMMEMLYRLPLLNCSGVRRFWPRITMRWPDVHIVDNPLFLLRMIFLLLKKCFCSPPSEWSQGLVSLSSESVTQWNAVRTNLVKKPSLEFNILWDFKVTAKYGENLVNILWYF